MSDAIEIIQTDTKSFFASCNICGEGVTSDTKKNSERWADNHAPADIAYLLAELRKAHEALERVGALADAFVQRGEHLIEFAKTAPEDVAESLTESGGDFLHKGLLIRAAVAAAKGDEQ